VCGGDWVRLGEREHGAKGLCQERALVTGYEAANSLAVRGVLKGRNRVHPVAKIRPDEIQVQAGKTVTSFVKGLLESRGIPGSPWVR